MATIYFWEIFINIIENIFIAFLLFRRLSLRNIRYSKMTFFCFVIFSTILVSSCNLTQISTTTTQIIIFLFRLFFILFCFNNTFAEKAFTSCLPSFMSMFADQVTYTIALLVATKNPTSFDFLGSNRVISTLIYLASECLFMIIFLYVLTDISYLPKKLYVFLVIITTIALLVSTFFLNIIIEIDTKTLSIKYRLELNNISILILAIFLSMLFLIQIISQTFQKNILLTEELHIYNMNAERNKSLLQSADNLRKWKHDYNNHLIAMQALIEKGAFDQLQKYIIHQKENLPQTFTTINCGHPIIDAILTNKYVTAKDLNIKFKYSVILPEHFPINDIELTGILGNLLDNAIEACQKVNYTSTSPYIEVSIRPRRNMLHFFIKNSSTGNYLYNKAGQLKTTKSEKEHHGNGIANVVSLIEKHSGFYKIMAEPEWFSVNIYIPLL
ncbi:MAG: GHKL domain-containing protein [Agathobacter sp.]|nr:GHKL domain-containing protein [Agathobacter sp.]MDY3909131.1 GHKL domain-containing protein [Eubacterium sp.]